MEIAADGTALRHPADADAGAVAAAVAASIDQLVPWMPWASADYGEADALAWIRGQLGDAHRFVMVAPGGDLIGTCGLNEIDEQNRSANLGYWVRSDRVGRGLATAATRSLASFGLGDAGFHRLRIVMSVRNEASRRVAEKAGAGYEGIARGCLLLRGEFHDAHVFSFVTGDI